MVSLADKIDSLVGFFGVGAKPTGSKDPFALRRAALGVIRIVLESGLRLPIDAVLTAAAQAHGFDAYDDDLLPFIRERLRVSLRDAGIAHDVVAAAFGNGSGDDGAGADDLLALPTAPRRCPASLGVTRGPACWPDGGGLPAF